MNPAAALLLLSTVAAPRDVVGWTFTTRQVDKHTQYAVTGRPRPDAKAQVRPGTLSLRCTDKDKRLKALYIGGQPGEGAPLVVSLDAEDPVVYYAEWETNLSARLPVARLLEIARRGMVLNITLAGSAEHYDLPALAAPLEELRGHCQFPELPDEPAALPPPGGRWTRRRAVAADGSNGVLLSLKGDNRVASLRLRCRPDELDLYLTAESGNQLADGALALQLDERPPVRIVSRSGSDGRALYLYKPRGVLRDLTAAARLNVTLPGNLGEPLVESFDLGGFAETLEPFAAVCGLRK